MTLGPDLVLSVFLIFARVAGCVMVIPGLSSELIPVRIRLLIAFALSAVLSPLLLETVTASVAGLSLWAYLTRIFTEILVGALLGLIGRLYYAALQLAATFMSHLIGLGGLLGTPVEGLEPVPALTSLVMISATVLLFVLDLHWLIIRAILDSYRLVAPGDTLNLQVSMAWISQTLVDVSLLAVRLAGPFIAYAIIVNLAVGITNKLTPQVPVFLISLPFVVAGGLLLGYFSIGNVMTAFADSFRAGLLGF